MKYQDAGRLVAGDHVYIFVPDRYPRLLDRLFASPTEVSPDDADFFGAFALDPTHMASELEDNYSPGLTEAELKLNIGQLILQRLGGRAEYADRVTIGPIELIVRDVDEAGRISSVGLSFEPTPAGHQHSAFPQPSRDSPTASVSLSLDGASAGREKRRQSRPPNNVATIRIPTTAGATEAPLAACIRAASR